VKRTPLRARPVDHSGEPGYRAWKKAEHGSCAACGARGLLLRHHVIHEQHVRALGGDPYDLRNAIQLGYYACACHREHHAAVRRLPRAILPPEAVEFATELLGAGPAEAYLSRYYS
jgi:hypothetical protein